MSYGFKFGLVVLMSLKIGTVELVPIWSCNDTGESSRNGQPSFGQLGTPKGKAPGADADLPSPSDMVCLSETNNARRINGNLPPMTPNPKLMAAAKSHSDFMAANDCYSHNCPGEDPMPRRTMKRNYIPSGIGENLAVAQTTCEGAVKQWLNSPGHRANLLSSYEDLGCAMAHSETSQYKYYWTCVYASWVKNVPRGVIIDH